MSAIFGFTFHIGRMTEVLTPDIYRAHCTVPNLPYVGDCDLNIHNRFNSLLYYYFINDEHDMIDI